MVPEIASASSAAALAERGVDHAVAVHRAVSLDAAVDRLIGAAHRGRRLLPSAEAAGRPVQLASAVRTPGS